MVNHRLICPGPLVLAPGGGALMTADPRACIRQWGNTFWHTAYVPVLWRRVAPRDNRPLLKQKDPEAVMRQLMEARYPIYGEADLTVDSREVAHDVIVGEILHMLAQSALLAKLAENGRAVAEPQLKG
jgi:shikimate kinase